MRQAVLKAANDLRYSPHAAARSLSSRRTHTIGVVLPDLHGEFFSELVRGIDQVAREHGQYLLVSSYHGHPEEQGAALRAMRGRVDGLLVMSPYVDDSGFLTENLSPSLPVVLINTHLPNAGFAVAAHRQLRRRGGRWCATWSQHGHRRIAFIAGPDDNFDARERLRGYRDALAELLARQPASGCCRAISAKRPAMRRAARSPHRPSAPDAVFAANDMMALGCLFAFNQAGIARAGRHRAGGLRRHSARALRAPAADHHARGYRRAWRRARCARLLDAGSESAQ